jgi:hypothetical protein
MGHGASIETFIQQKGVAGEDKYAATLFRRIELQPEDVDIMYTIFSDIKRKNPPPNTIDSDSISKYFDVKSCEFLRKMFAVVTDFDGDDAINFKEFTLGLWNFLSLSTDFLPALVFHLYDPMKLNNIDSKDFTEMLENIHGVKLSAFTLALNSITKKFNYEYRHGINMVNFGLLCVDNPFTVKPIVTLQHHLRKRVAGASHWKKLEFRRSASIRGKLKDINYVYQVNEETENWRKKDEELGIRAVSSEMLILSEFVVKEVENTATKKLRNGLASLRNQKLANEDVADHSHVCNIKDNEEGKGQVETLHHMMTDTPFDDEDISFDENDEDETLFLNSSDQKSHKNENIITARLANKLDVEKNNFEDFAELIFLTGDGKFVDPIIPIEAAAVFVFPGDERFVFGIVTDTKKNEDVVVIIDRDLSRRRIKNSDLSKINIKFKLSGYLRVNSKTLPELIRSRTTNISLLQICNDPYASPHHPPELCHKNECKSRWNEDLHKLVKSNEAAEGHMSYLQHVKIQRQVAIDDIADKISHRQKFRRLLTESTRVSFRKKNSTGNLIEVLYDKQSA